MSDERHLEERLRAALEEIRAGDPAPAFDETWEAARREAEATRRQSRARRSLAAAAIFVAAAGVTLWLRRPEDSPPPQVEAPRMAVAWRGPLDFLLETPADSWLTTTPSFRTTVDTALLDSALAGKEETR